MTIKKAYFKGIIMNIRDLEYYQQIINLRNFSKVANYFSVSQPTITTSMKRLEAELETTLIIRDQSHRQVLFTPSGEQFAEHVNIILGELKIANQEIEQLKNERVRFGLPPIIGTYYFPQIVGNLFKSGLMDHLDTVENGSQVLLHQLINGSLDMALLGSVEPIEDDHLIVRHFASKNFKIIVSKQHPLASRESVKFAELRNEKFIMQNEGFVHPIAFKKLTTKNHFKPKIIYTTSDSQIIKKMVAENIGVGFLTELALDPSDNLVALPLSEQDQPKFLMSLVYRTSHILTPTQAKLIDVLIDPSI
ncbi:LysR family transcriptional regulator [Dellaglioa algida DSM 15638]|uniref:LysR family transcriptional regulator n=2 Tax=Dellaglioa algida TaxID=105612 RepID=A0A0R1HQK0_9LACO|nr:LysR family transcriptional regulator [Dellaglioa algida DSM 15638]